MSSKDIELKIAEIVQQTYLSEVAQAPIEDEKWKIILDKTRILSETAFMDFLKVKNQSIYEDFLAKVKGCIATLRTDIRKEIDVYFNL